MNISRERWGSSSYPVLNGKLHYALPPDIDKPLHDAAADKIREYPQQTQAVGMFTISPHICVCICAKETRWHIPWASA